MQRHRLKPSGSGISVPAVTMYGPTSEDLIGTYGLHQQHMVSPFVCTQCYRHDCNYGDQLNPEPLCMLEITPQMLWRSFKNTIAEGGYN